jgi:hypothetical protein
VTPITCRDIGRPLGIRSRMASISVGFVCGENVVTLETHDKLREADAYKGGMGEKHGYI